MLTKGLPLPAVLREEPQYRLLFGSQVLSILGDRVTSVALPFAVLATGGGVGDVALVSAAQFMPFVVLALPAGVWADRLDRKRILIVSDLVRLVCQLVAASLLLGGGATVPAPSSRADRGDPAGASGAEVDGLPGLVARVGANDGGVPADGGAHGGVPRGRGVHPGPGAVQ